jgi:hypothetical protein
MELAAAARADQVHSGGGCKRLRVVENGCQEGHKSTIGF